MDSSSIDATPAGSAPSDARGNITLPLKAGGEILGVLGWDHLAEYRSWSPELLSRLELLASVYANALYRRRAQAKLQTSFEEVRELKDRARGGERRPAAGGPPRARLRRDRRERCRPCASAPRTYPCSCGTSSPASRLAADERSRR